MDPRTLMDYLPEYLQRIYEYRQILQAEEPELKLAYAEKDTVHSNFFLESLTEEGVERWEQIMGLQKSGSLEERRGRIWIKYMLKTPYTYRTLESFLGSISDDYKLNLQDYNLLVTIALAGPDRKAWLGETLRQMIPANLTMSIIGKFAQNTLPADLRIATSIGTLKEYNHAGQYPVAEVKRGDGSGGGLIVGGRNLILDSANLVVDVLDSTPGSKMEYQHISVGQSYMDVPSGTKVTISFDLEMQVNTANPSLQIYNTNIIRPKRINARIISWPNPAGSLIKERVSVATIITDHADVEDFSHNVIEFYTKYGTSNWFKITNLKVEEGNDATDWTPAPEDNDPYELLTLPLTTDESITATVWESQDGIDYTKHTTTYTATEDGDVTVYYPSPAPYYFFEKEI